MKCPYCAEDIKDEAIVCRFCKRDLILFQPFASRITALETSVAELREMLNSLAKVPTEFVKTAAARSATKGGVALIVGTLVTLLINLSCVVSRKPPTLMMVFCILSAAPFAVFLAAKGTYERVGQYFLVGLLQATVSASVVFVNAAVRTGFEPRLFPWALYVVEDGLLFLSAGLFRKYLKRRKGHFVPTDISAQLAFNLMGRPTISPGSSQEARWKRVSEATAALAPLLTLIASLVAAILGYLSKSAAQPR